LLRGGEPLARQAAAAPASESLLPAILALLAAHGLAPGALEAIAVSIGPGSFTGLRVGVATAKGLAFGGAMRVVAVPTLAALAAQGAAAAASDPGAPDAPVIAMLDARRGELYAASHRSEDPLAPPLWGPLVLPVAALAARIADEPGPVRVVGEGADAVAAAAGAAAAGRLVCLPPPAGAPDAAWVGRLGARLLAAGAGLAAADLAPVYVRRAEAEVRRLGTRFEGA
jgi:tRNA threonylcarbamoyladenosine biosynthesis protein TsaB